MQPYPGLRTSFGRVTCMARAASVPGLPTLGVYCCVVIVFGFEFRGRPATPGWGLACMCCGTGFSFAPPFLPGDLGCLWLCARSVCIIPFLARVCGVSVCA